LSKEIGDINRIFPHKYKIDSASSLSGKIGSALPLLYFLTHFAEIIPVVSEFSVSDDIILVAE